MGGEEGENADSTIDRVRRKLLKIGVYSVPTLILMGTATEAKASGGNTDDGEDGHEHWHRWRRRRRW